MIPGRDLKRQPLLAELNALLGQGKDQCNMPTEASTTLDIASQALPPSPQIEHDQPFEFNYDAKGDVPPIELEPPLHHDATTCQIKEYDKWQAMIPTLIPPYLEYLMHSLGRPPTFPPAILSRCEQV